MLRIRCKTLRTFSCEGESGSVYLLSKLSSPHENVESQGAYISLDIVKREKGRVILKKHFPHNLCCLQVYNCC